MADFARWVVAAEEALPWAPGEFMAAYDSHRAAAVELALEADPVASAVRQFMGGQGAREWQGTASELRERLAHVVGEQVARSRSWPASAQALSNRLRRVAPHLRAAGIEVDWSREAGSGSRRLIVLRVEGRT